MNEQERKISELNDYISKVKEELGKRESKLIAIEKKIVNLELELTEYIGTKSVRKGDVALTVTSAKFRSQLESKLKVLQVEALDIEREVNRARDRLKIAEGELREVKE